MAKLRTHYDNLKVTRNAPNIVIKAAHKALLQLHHPDKATDKIAAERITRILNEARDVLLDPIRREQHDLWIKEQEHNHQAHQVHQAHSTTQTATEQTLGHYIVSSNGTAIDKSNGLMWCRFALGQIWQHDSNHGEVKNYTWQAVAQAADEFNRQGGYVGHVDWRVPTLAELKTLLTPDSPAFIDARVFPKNPAGLWSCSPYVGYGGGAWLLDFIKGVALNDNSNLPRAIRLVRTVPDPSV